MAENEAPQGAAEVTAENTSQETAPKETDWKAEARKWESRAKESFAAAKSNEDAAKRLVEIEEAQKTEAQKQQEALEKAQKELAELTVAKTRAEVAAVKGVPVGLLSGSTQEELEASADALIAFRGDSSEPSPFPKPDPSQGTRGSSSGGTTADAFKSFVESKLS